MKYWPVPNSYQHSVPISGQRGSFWENRGDRRHAGIDIHSPSNSSVIAIDNGRVEKVGIFTSPDQIPYWNTTYFIIINHSDGNFFRYAELDNFNVNVGDLIKGGQIIGYVGTTLNKDKIDLNSPEYIQDLARSNLHSMLHLEIHSILPETNQYYSGGNYFLTKTPSTLIDPSDYMNLICSGSI